MTTIVLVTDSNDIYQIRRVLIVGTAVIVKYMKSYYLVK